MDLKRHEEQTERASREVSGIEVGRDKNDPLAINFPDDMSERETQGEKLLAEAKELRDRADRLEQDRKSLLEPIWDAEALYHGRLRLWRHWMVFTGEDRAKRTMRPEVAFSQFKKLYPQQAEENFTKEGYEK